MNYSSEDAKVPSWNVEELSAIVVDTAFHIHRDLGPGLLESVYQKVLTAVLREKGLLLIPKSLLIFNMKEYVFQGS